MEAAPLIQRVVQDIHRNSQKGRDSPMHLLVCGLDPVPHVAKSHPALPNVIYGIRIVADPEWHYRVCPTQHGTNAQTPLVAFSIFEYVSCHGAV